MSYALAFYILYALFVSSFVIIFVVTVLAALDFWVVRNVSGCILVGLRWWNEINDLGESVWKVESLDQEVRLLITSYAFPYQLIFTWSHHYLLVVKILINLSSLGLITLCLG